MESRKQRSFDKAIKYLNEEIADYDNDIAKCKEIIEDQLWEIRNLESARDDYIRIRDSLDINNWNGFLGEYDWIHINKHFPDNDEEEPQLLFHHNFQPNYTTNTRSHSFITKILTVFQSVRKLT